MNADVIAADDPGWGRAIRAGVPGILLLVTARLDRPLGNADGLTLTRAVFVSFLQAMLLIGVVVAVMAGSFEQDLPTGPVAGVVAGFGAFMLLAGRFAERPLDCSSDGALSSSYRSRFFLRIAFAESSALMGFVGFILSGNGWVYPVGLAVALVGFARLAPTAVHLEEDQRALVTIGCPRSLVVALKSYGAGPAVGFPRQLPKPPKGTAHDRRP